MTTQHTPAAATVSAPGERDIHVERVFGATRDRVWAAYTEPEQLAQWWGRGNQLDIERWEFERGGHWRFVEHHEGGTDGFEGRFREITPKERLVYSFEWDGMPAHVCIDSVEFVDLGDGRTRVVIDSQFLTAADRDGMLESGMEEGMNASYRALDALLAKAG
ncbi:polyketide cyclase [Rhodococcus spelaei]|uniref:Polyketide cyclase n=1 Tax=Rhodococcus spelaei TaxID=2546320 RepID=A0A541BNG5_9NOCA|nr:SRPBCC family protein [Rhodococcus spelaei]TQF73875.1 polyketide cyclase [Rhodococcus spelaei]